MIRRLDGWLFAPGTAHRMAVVRTGLAAVIGLRIALGPYRQLAGQPASLFRPPPLLSWLPHMPSSSVIAALQIIGVAAALLVCSHRKVSVTFPVAWLSLLVLAGLKGSFGKILHNDVLLILAAAPFLIAPSERSPGAATDQASARYGWPVRTSMVVIACAYVTAGGEKLIHSGLSWVTSDNMRWVLYRAASGGRVHDRSIPLAIADRPWLARFVAAAILATELCAPLILLLPRFRPVFIALAASLHLGTWATVGLDYWGWALTVAIVLVDWDAVAARTIWAHRTRHAVAHD